MKHSKKFIMLIVVLINIVFVNICPVFAANPAVEFCQQFTNWSKAKQLKWIDELDTESSIPAIKNNQDLSENMEKGQFGKIEDCFKSTENLYAKKIVAVCNDGMDTFKPFQDITKSRVTACIAKGMSGKQDPEWETEAVKKMSKKLFCPDWKAWNQDKRDDFMKHSATSAYSVLKKRNPSDEQMEEIKDCTAKSKAIVIKRLNKACKKKLTYVDAYQIPIMQIMVCANKAGIDMSN